MRRKKNPRSFDRGLLVALLFAVALLPLTGRNAEYLMEGTGEMQLVRITYRTGDGGNRGSAALEVITGNAHLVPFAVFRE